MNRFTSFTKSLVVAGVAFGAIAAASVAQARTDVAVTIAATPVQYHVQPAPVYNGHDRWDNRHDNRWDHRFERGGPDGDSDRDGIPNRFDRDSRFYDARAAYRHAAWGDYDHDGVPNRFDRAPYNPRRH